MTIAEGVAGPVPVVKVAADSPGLRRIVWSSVIGTAVEWYDFLIYGAATALVFNKIFFASGNATAATIAAETALTASLGKMFALAEAYPDLKANQSVQQLMEELSSTENKICFARQYYNDTATSLNTAVQSFPGNLIAGKFGFQNAELWRVSEAERAAVEVAPKVSLR